MMFRRPPCLAAGTRAAPLPLAPKGGTAPRLYGVRFG